MPTVDPSGNGRPAYYYDAATDTLLPVIGTPGKDGVSGTDGADGVGVPAGGTTGQALVKATDTDFDTEWGAAVGGNDGLPVGGIVADVLSKTAAADFATAWALPGNIPVYASAALRDAAIPTPRPGQMCLVVADPQIYVTGPGWTSLIEAETPWINFTAELWCAGARVSLGTSGFTQAGTYKVINGICFFSLNLATGPDFVPPAASAPYDIKPPLPFDPLYISDYMPMSSGHLTIGPGNIERYNPTGMRTGANIQVYCPQPWWSVPGGGIGQFQAGNAVQLYGQYPPL